MRRVPSYATPSESNHLHTVDETTILEEVTGDLPHVSARFFALTARSVTSFQSRHDKRRPPTPKLRAKVNVLVVSALLDDVFVQFRAVLFFVHLVLLHARVQFRRVTLGDSLLAWWNSIPSTESAYYVLLGIVLQEESPGSLCMVGGRGWAALPLCVVLSIAGPSWGLSRMA